MALGLALALNGALVFFLVVWRGRGGQAGPMPIRAVPLRVVETELQRPVRAEIEPPQEAAAAQPPAEPPLPSPPAPRMPAPDSRLHAPAPLEVPPARPDSTGLPLFTAEAVQPLPRAMPVDVRPGGLPAGGTPTATGKIRASRGPILIRPPSLSDYYPHRARMRQVTGTSTLRLTIDARGNVIAVEVVRSTPEGVFETAARRVGRSLRFQPAVQNGRAVPAAVLLNLIWKLE